MFKFASFHTRCFPILSESRLIRVVSCGLRHRRVAEIHSHSADQCNRGDDLPIGVESMTDPTKVQRATTLWKKEELMGRINALLKCNPEDSERVYLVNKKTLKTVPPKHITNNIQLLLDQGITESSILNHPKILSINQDELKKKLDCLVKFKDLQDINHVVPFLNISLDVLEKVVEKSQNEMIEHGNRIYYLNAQTGVDVETISRYFATSIRVYKIALEKFKLNLAYCLKHLEPSDIVRHLSVLAYASSSIVERLQMLKNSPLQKIKPWMVRVPNLALEKSFEKVIERGADPTFKDPLTEVWFENHVLKRLECLLDCSEKEAKSCYDACKGAVSLLENVEQLLERQIKKETILQNPAVLVAKKQELAIKVNKLAELVGLRDMNDLIPLCTLKPYQVVKIVNSMNNESFPNNSNRIYYFADKARLQPAEIARQFARRTFMFRIPKESFIENLDHFVDNMDSEDVLADLWAFKYSPAVVAERIARAKRVRGKKVMPWMVRCPDTVLEKSLQLTKENGELLGENETIVEYFGKRLGFNRDITNSIFLKTPSVRNVRVTKVKKVIDYLLEELDYTPHDIAINPRILMHSLHTIKKRMEQLRQIGCRPRSLIIVCRSQRQYDLFVKEWEDAKERRNRALAAGGS
nr:uncharacterized protein LOC109432907 [Aedes albopictus]